MKTFIILCIVCCYKSCKSQSIENLAKSFLEKQENLGDGKIYYDTLFLNKERHIIKFGILGAHELPYLIIRNDVNIDNNVINNYSTKRLLKKVSFTLDELSESEQLELLRKILDIAESHLKMDGWEVIE